jgi:hypothetical protein
MFKNIKIKIWQYLFFTDESSIDKENSIWGKKSWKSDVYGLN